VALLIYLAINAAALVAAFLWLIAAEAPVGLWALPGPILLTWTLMKWSGVPTVERRLQKARPDYAQYIATTSGFIPWPPKRA
jgi:steroid 5-alpha reductase family enzyme